MNLDDAIDESSQQIGLRLKDKQIEAIKAFCSGQDVFVSLPTGYGKSTIYAILPLVYDRIKGMVYSFPVLREWSSVYAGKKGSIIVCISPLNAIMVEQQAKYLAMGISVEYVGEGQKNPLAWRNVVNGEVQLVYISPENIICNPQYRHMLRSAAYKERLVGIVVDEAHCVKTW